MSGRRAARGGALAVVLAVSLGCQETAKPPTASAAPAPAVYACGRDGFLAASLYGAIDVSLDWKATDIACEGMPRPDGEGARLRFAGSSGDQPIAIIIAMPELERGIAATEIPSNVTLIEEGGGRFFSTADLANCWTDVNGFEATGESEYQYVIGGNLYCVSPLAEINGDSSVSIRELAFRGLLNWDAR